MKKIFSLLLLAIQLALFIYGLVNFVFETYYFMGFALLLYLFFCVAVSFLLWAVLFTISHLFKLKNPANYFLLKGTMIMWAAVIAFIFIATALWIKGIENDQQELTDEIKASEKSRILNALTSAEEYRFIGYDDVRKDWLIQDAAGDTLFIDVHTTEDLALYEFDGKRDTVQLIEHAFERLKPFMNPDSIAALKNHLLKGSYCVRPENKKTVQITIPCSDYPFPNYSVIIYYGPYAFRRKKGMVMSLSLSAESR